MQSMLSILARQAALQAMPPGGQVQYGKE